MAKLMQAEELRVRIQALDEKTGRALSGASVRLTVDQAGDCAGPMLIGALTTNADGIVSFSGGPLAGAIRRDWPIQVNFGGVERYTYPLDIAALAETGAVQSFSLPDGLKTFTAETGGEAGRSKGRWTDAGLRLDDLWSSPSIFPELGDLVFGDDSCSRLIPSDQTLRIFQQTHVALLERNVMTCTSSGSDPNRPETLTLHSGEAISHEIAWRRLGYTFGDLLYSLALAPGETAKLSLSSWEQRQRAAASRASETGERQSAQAVRANALSETMNAATNHFGVAAGAAIAEGASVGAELGGGVGAKLGLSRALGLSAGFNRNTFSASAAREFGDRIQQVAEVYRRDHQTLVAEQSETEAQSVSTRTVCNKNWGKVLNIFYHEVLENHRVTTRKKGTRQVYFIPHARPDFDAERAFCTRALLRPYLLDAGLERCYEALEHVLFDPRYGEDEEDDAPEDDEAEADEADDAPEPTTTRFWIQLRIGSNGLNKGKDASLIIGLHSGGERSLNINRTTRWKKNSSYSVYVDANPGIEPADIAFIGFHNQSGVAVRIDTYTVSFNDPNGGWTRIGSFSPGKVKGGAKVTRRFDVDWTSDTGEIEDDEDGAPEQVPDRASLTAGATFADRKRCAAALVEHLNCHAFYYNSLLWLLRDRNERYSWLESFSCGGTPLSDRIEPEPVAVLGHYVAFPAVDSVFDTTEAGEILDDRLVVLPTSGVFADAALGQCWARETDLPEGDDPFWKWVDKPNKGCGDAPKLAAPSADGLLGADGLDFSDLTDTLLSSAPETALGADVASSLAEAFGAGLAKNVLGRMTEADVDKVLEALTAALGDSKKDKKNDKGGDDGSKQDGAAKDAKKDDAGKTK